MLAGEAWAYQLYFKEIYCIPKKYKQDTAKILPLSLEKSGDINERIKVFIEALNQFEDYTYDDIMLAIKNLNAVKTNEIVTAQNNILENRESLMEKVKEINKAIDGIQKKKED